MPVIPRLPSDLVLRVHPDASSARKACTLRPGDELPAGVEVGREDTGRIVVHVDADLARASSVSLYGAADATLEVTTEHSVYVARDGRGSGDVVLSGPGGGTAVRNGAGDGDALCPDGPAECFRLGAGRGEAYDSLQGGRRDVHPDWHRGITALAGSALARTAAAAALVGTVALTAGAVVGAGRDHRVGLPDQAVAAIERHYGHGSVASFDALRQTVGDATLQQGRAALLGVESRGLHDAARSPPDSARAAAVSAQRGHRSAAGPAEEKAVYEGLRPGHAFEDRALPGVTGQNDRSAAERDAAVTDQHARARLGVAVLQDRHRRAVVSGQPSGPVARAAAGRDSPLLQGGGPAAGAAAERPARPDAVGPAPGRQRAPDPRR